jgi:carboxyl-terminal processing protease
LCTVFCITDTTNHACYNVCLPGGSAPGIFVESVKSHMLNTRTVKTVLLTAVITGLVIVAFGAGVGTAWILMHGRTASAEEAAEFGVFWEAWHLVEDNFFGELPDMQNVTWGAIRGALATLNDPPTTFLEPQPRQREKERLSGRYGGIGSYVTQAEDGSIILDPMPDLPAAQAGVQKGDVVLKVDDTELTPEMTIDEVADLIKGEIGTIVRLTLRREGVDEPVVIEIERQDIPAPSAEWRMLEQAEGVGYIRIMLFSGRTAKELESAIEELEELGMTSLIVDLRGNGGGLFDAAIDVASVFLRDGVVVYQVDKDGDRQSYETRGGGHFTDGPMILLVDGGTASASEIVAGALRDRDQAVLVGEKTFGKGSVQSVYDLSDGSSVHITSAKWLTPDQYMIDGQGIVPDFEVITTDEDRSQGRDAQLERAIEYLTTGE